MQLACLPDWLFQPTRPRRARHYVQEHFYFPQSFNPRAHEGRDMKDQTWVCRIQFQPTRPRRARQRFSNLYNYEHVSTHAPTKGATTRYLHNGTNARFQPTRPRRARPWIMALSCVSLLFQPTRPRRARLLYRIFPIQIPCVSTHAPTKGATVGFGLAVVHVGFNPRAHEGRDA